MVDLLKDFPHDAAEAPPETKTYRLALRPGCPRQVLVIGGQDFPTHTEEVERLEGGTTSRSRVRGVIRELSKKQVDRIRSMAKKKVFRGRRLLDIGPGSRFRFTHGDEPVGKYLILEEISEALLPELLSSVAGASEEEDAITEDAKKSEREARKDPKDVARRRAHKLAKQAGEKVDAS